MYLHHQNDKFYFVKIVKLTLNKNKKDNFRNLETLLFFSSKKPIKNDGILLFNFFYLGIELLCNFVNISNSINFHILSLLFIQLCYFCRFCIVFFDSISDNTFIHIICPATRFTSF